MTERPEGLLISDVRGRATITVREAASLLGVGRDQAYVQAQAGTIPTLRLGRRVLVPVPALLRQLGYGIEDGETGA